MNFEFGFHWDMDRLPTLTTQGEAVTWRERDNGRLTAMLGDQEVLNVFITDIFTGGFEIWQHTALDHGDGEDELNFSLGYSLIDGGGNTTDGALEFTVKDDTPEARDDWFRIPKGQSALMDVIANDDFGGDGVTKALVDASVRGGADVGSVVLQTVQDKLRFVPHPDFVGDAVIDYTMQDSDGDLANGVLVVSVHENGGALPTTLPSRAVVDEDGLVGGIAGGVRDVGGEAVVATGSLGYDWGGGRGPGNFRWSIDPTIVAGVSALGFEDDIRLKLSDDKIRLMISDDGLSLSGVVEHPSYSFPLGALPIFNLEIVDVRTGEYRFELFRPLGHDKPGEDDLIINFGYSLISSNGKSVDGVLKVIVDDDSGRANDDSATTTSATPVTVDVLSNDEYGADGAGSKLIDATVQGGDEVGSVVANRDGSLTFAPALGFVGVALIDYESRPDGDGDRLSATLSVTVTEIPPDVPTTPETDGDPATQAAILTVDEDGLPGGLHGGVEDAPTRLAVATTSLGYGIGDDGPGDFSWHTDSLPGLRAGKELLTWALRDAGRVLVGLDGKGDSVISVGVTDLVDGTVEVALARPLDHADGLTEDDLSVEFGYTISDSNGDTADGVFKVVIDDDRLQVEDEAVRTLVDTSVRVDVLANDAFGADGFNDFRRIEVQGGAQVGRVLMNDDNTFIFEPARGFIGTALIDYRVSDGDGDVEGGTLAVIVSSGLGADKPTTPDSDDNPDTVAALALLDEDGLPGGNPGGRGDTPGEATVVTGWLGYEFGDDGRGDFRWSTEGLPQLTSQDRPLSWSLNATGHTLMATDSEGNDVISVRIIDILASQYRVELLRPLDYGPGLSRALAPFEGDINFSVGYTITDRNGDSADGSLNISVDDDAPRDIRDYAWTTIGTPLTIDVLSNYPVGADGLGTFRIIGGEPDETGSFTVNPDNTLTYTPHRYFEGTTSISYYITDADDSDDVDVSTVIAVTGPRPGAPTTPETDADPRTERPMVRIHEDGLPGGVPGEYGDEPAGPTVVAGFLGYDFGDDGPGDVRWASEGLSRLPSLARPLSWSLNATGHTLTGADGEGNEVISFHIINALTSRYRVELHRPLDHFNTGWNWNWLTFGVDYLVTDADGDTTPGTLEVTVVDDTPYDPNGDRSELAATTTLGTPLTLDVLSDDRLGGDGKGGIVEASTSGGTVVVNPDNTLTFTPRPDVLGDVKVRYLVTDGDGDTAKRNLVVTVEQQTRTDVPTTPETDGDPATVADLAEVDEGGLPGGNKDAATTPTMATGLLGYDFGDDGPGSFRWHTDSLPTLTSAGESVDWRLSDNGGSLVGSDGDGEQVVAVQLTDLDSGRYTVALDQPLDHPYASDEGDLALTLGYTISDADGDSADGLLRVSVYDDSPQATDDSATIERGSEVTLDVLANDAPGADGGGEIFDVTLQGGSDVGSVTLNDDNTLTFRPKGVYTGTALIDYAIRDGDGDISRAQFAVTVEKSGNDVPTTPETDGDPATGPDKAVVDEDGLPGGVPGGIKDVPNGVKVANGVLGYDFGDDGWDSFSFSWDIDTLPVLYRGGDPIDWELYSKGRLLWGVDAADGQAVLQLQHRDLASGAYRVVMFRSLDHGTPGIEDDLNFSVGYTVTDFDGDTAYGELRVTVDDDSPQASDDSATTTIGTSVTLDVLGNDAFGADGSDGVVAASVQGGASVGSISVNDDDTLTFVPGDGFSGSALIDYTMQDRDGDTSDAQLTVTVEGQRNDVPTTPETDDDPATGPDEAVVDEDGLAGGVRGGVSDAPTEDTIARGVLGYDVGDDGLGGFTWHTDSLPALTSGGDSVNWRLSGNGRSLVGFDGSGERVISVQLTDLASGSYKVALARPLDHAYDGSIEGDIAFSVGYTITDSDGDSASGVLSLTVDDDTPVPRDDFAATGIDTPVTVDVLANDAFGADGGVGVVAASVQGGAAVGTVSVNSDDTLTFVPSAGFTGSALIDYSVSDGDVDTSDGRLTVTITPADVPTTPESDGDPATGPAKAVVDEDGLAGGIHGGVGDALTEQTVGTGVLGYLAGDDGPGEFTWHTDRPRVPLSGGDRVDWRLSGNGHSLVGFDGSGERVISVQLTDLASGSYKVALAQPLRHTSDGGIESDFDFSVGYTITDSDGDSADGALRITVDDDSPQASDDSATTDSNTPVTVDVLANDAFGADGCGGVGAASVQGGASVGSVSVNADDSLTFVPGDGFTGSALIDYSVSDGDRDFSDGRLTVTVGDPQGGDTPTAREAEAQDDVLGNVHGDVVANAEASRLALSELLDESDEEVAAWLPPEQDQTDSVGPASAGGSGGGSGGVMDSGADSEQALALNGAGAGDSTLERIGQEAALLVE
ncbi:tandem-95 repeat protein [Halomonas sp. DN3]|uniref:Ig-like domain-containing protein n=1 Tax=Halomonas sp. DN3 TaxID=2953657 RepID=UPI0020A106EA|nr:tandem-95 repeat protein [Halomonas sp. DN3]USZ48796.1 tandem-95 repeat protein [Halomonas sp. DN3]